MTKEPTTPPDFIEQARQLVRQWLESMPRSPAGTMIADASIGLANIQSLERLVASFAAEAATAALEQAAQVAEKADAWAAQRRKGERIADKIRALKPEATTGDDREQRQ